MNSLFGFFWNKLRLSKPWNAKVPFLISILYFFILFGSVTFRLAVESFLASIVLIIGFAGLGYTLNDLGDKNSDEKANKQNAIASINSSHLGLLILFFMLLVILPWFFLPFNLNSLLLIIIELILFFMYALPPFRLKELSWLGVITDALYGHFIPAALAINTYAQLSQTPINNYMIFVTLLLLWQFVLGLRNIIFHQLQDFENDKRASINTLVIKLGIDSSTKFVIQLLWIESIMFATLIFSLSYLFNLKIYLIGFILYVIFSYYKIKPAIQTMNYRAKAYLFLDDFYIQWLPLLSLLLMMQLNYLYVLLFLLHLILFKNELKRKLINIYNNIFSQS